MMIKKQQQLQQQQKKMIKYSPGGINTEWIFSLIISEMW